MLKKLFSLIFFCSIVTNIFAETELDYMEYANDGDAQSAYVSSDSGSVVTVDFYSEANYDASSVPAYLNNINGQALTLSDDVAITSIKVYITRKGSPTGNAYVKIYNCTGTPGTDGKPIGSAVATSDALDVSTVSADPTFTLYEFTFSTPYNASAGGICIALFYGVNDYPTNYIRSAIDTSSPTHSGNFFRTTDGGSNWTPYSGDDYIFYIYTTTDNLQSYSESSIIQQGSYSLKGVAAQTDSLNDTLTRTVNPTIDLSGLDDWIFYIYSNRTGSNIKVGIRDSGSTTTETTPNITSAGAWQKVTVDISGVSNANKDAIDRIILTPVNADAANTFYVDNMFAESVARRRILLTRKYLYD